MAGLDQKKPDQRQNEGQAKMYSLQTLDDLMEIVHCVISLEKQRCLKIRLWIYGGLGLPHSGSLSSMSIKKAAVPKDQAVDLRRKRQDVYLAAESGKSFFDNRIWKRFD